MLGLQKSKIVMMCFFGQKSNNRYDRVFEPFIKGIIHNDYSIFAGISKTIILTIKILEYGHMSRHGPP